MELVIVEQPEAQHRARYQTEGSRGAIKDATGNPQGFPVIKVCEFSVKKCQINESFEKIFSSKNILLRFFPQIPKNIHVM